MKAPAAITFDFWGTLFADVDDGASQRQTIRADHFAAVTGAPRDKVNDAHEDASRRFLMHHIEKQQTLTPKHAVQMMCEYCDVSLDVDAFEAMVEFFATVILDVPPMPIAGCHEAVMRTAERCPIAIVSDAGLSPGRSLRVLLERENLLDAFTTLAFSDEVGVAKPQRPMFEAAAAGMGVAIESILHLGDLEPTDIDGAIAVGAQAGLFTGHHDKYLATTRAHHHFPNWGDYCGRLPDIVGGG